jgi:hypothetical protein
VTLHLHVTLSSLVFLSVSGAFASFHVWQTVLASTTIKELSRQLPSTIQPPLPLVNHGPIPNAIVDGAAYIVFQGRLWMLGQFRHTCGEATDRTCNQSTCFFSAVVFGALLTFPSLRVLLLVRQVAVRPSLLNCNTSMVLVGVSGAAPVVVSLIRL